MKKKKYEELENAAETSLSSLLLTAQLRKKARF